MYIHPARTDAYKNVTHDEQGKYQNFSISHG